MRLGQVPSPESWFSQVTNNPSGPPSPGLVLVIHQALRLFLYANAHTIPNFSS